MCHIGENSSSLSSSLKGALFLLEAASQIGHFASPRENTGLWGYPGWLQETPRFLFRARNALKEAIKEIKLPWIHSPLVMGNQKRGFGGHSSSALGFFPVIVAYYYPGVLRFAFGIRMCKGLVWGGKRKA